MKIRMSEPDDAQRVAEHMVREAAQSGQRGAPIYHPYPADRLPSSSEFESRVRLAGGRPLTEVGWRRLWVLQAESGDVVGHADLSSGRVVSELHRATLGMGIEEGYRGAGHGRRLLDAALQWARANQLAWIDLGVFEGNDAAMALYRRAGFVEVGRREDQFRVDGHVITDIMMSLALGA